MRLNPRSCFLAYVLLNFLAFMDCVSALAKESQIVRYKIGKSVFESQFMEPDGHVRGNLLMFPNWLGPDNGATIEKAASFVDHGYRVFLADFYGVDTRPQNQEEASVAAGYLLDDRMAFREHVNEALRQFKKKLGKEDKVATIGFCLGGAASLELARSGADISHVVTFHGNLSSPTPEDAAKIQAKILVLNGADDPLVTKDEINAFEKEMKDAGVDWALFNYGGTVHSFTNPEADQAGIAQYNARTTLRAYIAMQEFLELDSK